MMKLIKLSEYFDIYNGIAKSSAVINDIKENENFIPYIRPSQSYENSLDGYVDKRNIKNEKVFKKYTLYVSTDGEGSHSYSYLASFEFVPNSNVVALVEKIPLKIEEKLFYAKCITNNRFKFSYSRKPKKTRIANLLIPTKESIPDFVYNQKIKTISKEALCNKQYILNTDNWKDFRCIDIFNMEAGKYYPGESYNEGCVPLVSASENNNGIIEFSNLEPKYNNCLTIGKIAISTFYQNIPFVATSDVTILIPKIEIFNKYIGLFIATILNQEKYKWSYGRQIRLNDCQKLSIKLPTTEQGLPDWQFMENYIKSLPYSSSL